MILSTPSTQVTLTGPVMFWSIAGRRVQDCGVEVFGWPARDRPTLSRPSMHRKPNRENVTWMGEDDQNCRKVMVSWSTS